MPKNSAKEIKNHLSKFKTAKKSKGPIKDWTDAFLLKERDKMRKFARKHRGEWSLEFYETLQDLNKASVKRKLPQATA